AEHQLELAPRELHGWEWDHLHSRLDDSFNVLRPATGERPSLLNTPQGIRVVWIAPNSLRVTDEQGSECAALSSRLFSGLLEWAWVNPQRGDVLVVTVDEHQNVLVIDEAGRIRLRANGKMKGSVRTVAVSPDSSRLAVFWANDDFLGVFELF